MLRRLAGVVAAAVLLTGVAGCDDPEPASIAPIAWDTAPSTDEQRLAILAAARAIDPCALIPRPVLEEHGTVLSVAARSTDSCAAELDSTDFGKKTSLNWSIFLSAEPLEPLPDSVESRLGDASVVAQRDTPPDPDVLTHPCTGLALYPATVGVSLQISTPVADKPCALLDRVLPGALDRLRTQPAAGTSPDNPVTPLTGADPCAVTSRLGVSTPVDKQFLFGCVFEYRGTTVDLQYSYEQQGILTQGESLLEVNGHRGYDLRSVTENYWYGAILGAPLASDSPPSSLGPRVPVVKLTGRDPAVLREVLTATAELFPAA